MAEFTCPGCGVQFIRENNAQKFCSKKCRKHFEYTQRKSLGTITILQLCGYCGKGFHAKTKRKYCCADCRKAANNRKKIGIVSITRPPETILSIEEVAKLSREEGLSYGKYVQKYKLQ